ncbi:MAG: hypothetical protein E7314_05975 [Clostridiales bacterium]|nr:hypothetical protein [Clostridiales bacterium]
MKKKDWIFLVAVMLITTFIKIWFIINIPLKPVYDFETLYKVAVNLFNGNGFTLNGYEWGFQSYGYPLILSLFFRLVNSSSIFTAKVFNVIISTLTLPVLFFIFNKVFKNKKIVYGLFILSSFLPNMITYNNVLGTEILSVFLLSVLICLLVHLNEKNKKWNLVLQGLVCGILSLVKPFFMAYPVVILWILFMHKKDVKKLLKRAVWLITGFLVVLIPSIIKNYNQFGEFIPISYNGGFTLFVNNNSQNSSGSWMNASKVESSKEFEQNLRDVGYELKVDAKTEKEQCLRNPKASGVFKNEAIKWIINNPIEFITLGFLRIKNVLFSGANDIQLWSFEAATLNRLNIQEHRVFMIFMGVANSLVCTLSIAFFVVLFANIKNVFLEKTNLNKLIVLWTLLFFCAVYFVIEGQARYNFPMLFLMVMCVGFIAERLDDNK